MSKTESKPQPTSESTPTLSAHQRFLAAKIELQANPVPKNRTGQVGTRKYQYADLSDMLGVVNPILHKHGFYVMFQAGSYDNMLDSLGVEIIDANNSRGFARCFFPVKLEDDPQRAGSQITYYKRYALGCVLGINPEDDDDGDAASKKKEPERKGAGPTPLEEARKLTGKQLDEAYLFYTQKEINTTKSEILKQVIDERKKKSA